ncbi:MAG: DUF6362 family protein [Alphaproteobacteria bacterium]|nr:DUF6362 family protein [Alphaproteobacteria bacterium]
MSKTYWTASLVEERMEEAASVLKRLPQVRVKGYFNVWPTIIPEFSDLVGREPRPMKRPCPSPSEITRMEETLSWTVGLDPVDAKIVWMRAYGERWKRICAKFGISRSGADQHWLYALAVIAWRLNGSSIPKNMTRNRMLALVRYGQDGNGSFE